MPKVDLVSVSTLNKVIHFNDWNIFITKLPSDSFVSKASQFGTQFNLRAISADLPRKTVNPIEYSIRGHKIYVPGDTEFDSTITIQLLEQTDTLVMEFFEEWFQACYATYTGYKGVVDQLKATFQMQLLDRQLKPVWVYNLYGVWPQTIDLGSNLTGDKGADIVRPTITLNFDWYDTNPPNRAIATQAANSRK